MRFLLRARQHCRRINVLPPGLPNIDRQRFPILSHQSHAIGQTAVVILERAAQVIKHDFRTEKNPRVDRVVILELFSDRDDQVILRLYFHRVVQIEDRIDFVVDGQVQLAEVREFIDANPEGWRANLEILLNRLTSELRLLSETLTRQYFSQAAASRQFSVP